MPPRCTLTAPDDWLLLESVSAAATSCSASMSRTTCWYDGGTAPHRHMCVYGAGSRGVVRNKCLTLSCSSDRSGCDAATPSAGATSNPTFDGCGSAGEE